MRKGIAIIGAVLLVLAIIFFFVGLHIIVPNASSLAGSNVTVNQYSAGKFDAGPFSINSTSSLLTLTTTNSSSVLVSAQNLSKVSNMTGACVITPSDRTSSSGETILIYDHLSKGEYYLVTFSNSAPTVKEVTVNITGTLIVGALLTVMSFIIGVIGLVVLIIGLVMKPKRPKDPEMMY
ncbi:hypothetical protein [Caldiplasma sukawensis]